jgi:hypothetical protein
MGAMLVTARTTRSTQRYLEGRRSMRTDRQPAVLTGFDSESAGRRVRRFGRGRWAGALLAVVAMLLAAAGCGGEDDPAVPTASPPGSVPSTPAAGTVAPEHVPVIDAYEAFVRAAAEAFNRGEPDDPALAEHADGPALVRVRAAIEEHASNGRVYQGSPLIESAEVTSFDLDAPPEEPNAQILACVDITNYVLVYEQDGSPVPVERGLERYQATADLWLVDDRWLVVDFEELRETPCER